MKTTTTEDPTENLEPLEPNEAEQLWRDSRENELAESTLQLQGYHISQFTEWLVEERDIDDLRDLSGRTIHRFKLSLQGDLKQNTVAQRVSTVVRFLKFCVAIDAVAPHVPEQIELPKRNGKPRTESLEPEVAEAALNHLRKFAYASDMHALLALTWHTGLRTGTLRSFDVEDVEEEHNRLRVRHRPECNTPLKNRETAERYVSLSPKITEILIDWIAQKRPTVEDQYGRKPLFATNQGRASVNTLRRWFQGVTRPCMFGDECPHNREQSDCRAAQTLKEASECPSSVSGHPVRRGAITEFLRQDIPVKVVSDRMNVSQDVLDEHYDVRSESEKAEQRRQYLSGI
jgi:site-specific recombinase XerD